jgi:transposase
MMPMPISGSRSVPGIGRILTLVILYESEDIHRFPTVQQFCSYARLAKCSKESAGKTYGYSGKKIGNAYLKWAFSEAAALFLKGNPKAQQYIERQAQKYGKGALYPRPPPWPYGLCHAHPGSAV